MSRLGNTHALVTGGAGFIGSNLVDALVARGCRIRILDDLSTGRRENVAAAVAEGDVELVVADVRDLDAMRDAVQGVDVVFHLAASGLRISLRDPWPSHSINTGGTLCLLEACREQPPRRLVYCSSSEVYGSALAVPMSEDHPTRPTTVYGASKLAGEWHVLAYRELHGFSAVVVRPFNAYGYRAPHNGVHGEVIPRMVARALNGRPPLVFGDGAQSRDFTFVTDTVRGLIAACECDDLDGEAVNIACGREVSVSEIARLVCDVCGTPPTLEHHVPRPADVRRHLADTAKARKWLGFEARVEIEDGIDRYVTWVRERYPDPAALLDAA